MWHVDLVHSFYVSCRYRKGSRLLASEQRSSCAASRRRPQLVPEPRPPDTGMARSPSVIGFSRTRAARSDMTPRVRNSCRDGAVDLAEGLST